jgi:tetratricopeptide (TPR) repeat protein
MAEQAPAASGRTAVDELLPLTLSRPGEALARARAVLAARPGPREASVAHQAAGIVLREFGDVEAGVRELRLAVRLARRSGLAEREADVLAALGVGLVYAERTAAGLAAFDRAVSLSDGVLEARVRYRRSLVLWTLGRHPAALEDARHAVAVLSRAGDKLWTARALNVRGLVYTALGAPRRADADFVASMRLFAETSQVLESIYPVENRARPALAAGDLPAALSYLDEAAARYRPLNVVTTGLSIDRCTVLLAAGLAADALSEAETAIQAIESPRGRHTVMAGTDKARLLLTAANCALAAERPQAALDWAEAAYRLSRSQRSELGAARAALVIVRARYAAGQSSAALLRRADRVCVRLADAGTDDAAQAHLLAGRVALALGRRAAAARHFSAAASSLRRGPPLSRVSGWISRALQAQAVDDSRQLLAACRCGLAVLDEHRFTLGASELRAQATAHGAELALLAQRHAARAGPPRLLLAWSERWRATALAVPPVRPAADAELTDGLVALRAVTRLLEAARQRGSATAALRREQQRLEGLVRACALRTRGDGVTGRGDIDVAELFDELGTAELVEIVDIDGVLFVLVCAAGKVRQFTAGRTADAVRAADFARFALRRLGRARPGDDPGSALAILAESGSRLEQALLGPAARWLSGGPVVIVPPGRLHAIPWTLIPALRDRAVSVAPSAGAWLQARQTRPPTHRRVVLARGPGLVSDGAEVTALARLYDKPTVLGDVEATTQRVLHAMEGAWLAHIAAHGTFRADSPLFSSLRLHDGALTVYDFEQLVRAPYRVLLPSCDSGVQAPAGADELLGLVASLLPLGTAGIVASIVPLNDEATVPAMLELHRHLRAGGTIAESLHQVRQERVGDPVMHATVASLVALGAA